MANDGAPSDRASTSRPAPAPGGSGGGRPPTGPGTAGGARCRSTLPAPRSSSAPPGPSPHGRRVTPPAGSPHPGRRHSSAPRPAHARDHFPRFIRPGKHGGPSLATIGPPRGRRTPTRLATVPTATDRLFMDGESDAAAVSVALTVREAVRRQRSQASRGRSQDPVVQPGTGRPHRGLRPQAAQHQLSGAVQPALQYEQGSSSCRARVVGDWNTMSTGTHRQAGAVRHSPTNPGRPQAGLFDPGLLDMTLNPPCRATVRPTAWLRHDLSIAVCPGNAIGKPALTSAFPP
jgi:hypothetical protein